MNEFFLLQSNIIPFTPMAEVLWELVWQLRVPLNPCERDLLNTRSLRRLEFACTFGAGDWVMPTHHSRLFHVRGVFALTAHFRPDDEVLRLATLLYDVGHGPFSHSAEALPGFDHHQAGRRSALAVIQAGWGSSSSLESTILNLAVEERLPPPTPIKKPSSFFLTYSSKIFTDIVRPFISTLPKEGK